MQGLKLCIMEFLPRKPSGIYKPALAPERAVFVWWMIQGIQPGIRHWYALPMRMMQWPNHIGTTGVKLWYSKQINGEYLASFHLVDTKPKKVKENNSLREVTSHNCIVTEEAWNSKCVLLQSGSLKPDPLSDWAYDLAFLPRCATYSSDNWRPRSTWDGWFTVVIQIRRCVCFLKLDREQLSTTPISLMISFC